MIVQILEENSLDMKERGFFDECIRLDELTQLGDPLVVLDEKIDWEKFRPILRKIRPEKNPDNIKNAGRKPLDEVMMFKVILIQHLYNLSDDQTEFQLKDRRSFERFVSGGHTLFEMPDAKTIWHYKEQFKNHNVAKKAFDAFNRFLNQANILAKSGKIVDASFVDVPKQRNTRDENQGIKEKSEVPKDWSENKKRQKDVDARWVTKNKEKHFGYKNHVLADKKSKLIVSYEVGPASEHDSQKFGQITKKVKRHETLWADSAYKSKAIDKKLQKKSIKNKINEKGVRGRPLSKRQKISNRAKSKVRARVEHIFGAISWMGGNFMRCIGLERADEYIGMVNLVYNMRRYCFLSR